MIGDRRWPEHRIPPIQNLPFPIGGLRRTFIGPGLQWHQPHMANGTESGMILNNLRMHSASPELLRPRGWPDIRHQFGCGCGWRNKRFHPYHPYRSRDQHNGACRNNNRFHEISHRKNAWKQVRRIANANRRNKLNDEMTRKSDCQRAAQAQKCGRLHVGWLVNENRMRI